MSDHDQCARVDCPDHGDYDPLVTLPFTWVRDNWIRANWHTVPTSELRGIITTGEAYGWVRTNWATYDSLALDGAPDLDDVVVRLATGIYGIDPALTPRNGPFGADETSGATIDELIPTIDRVLKEYYDG